MKLITTIGLIALKCVFVAILWFGGVLSAVYILDSQPTACWEVSAFTVKALSRVYDCMVLTCSGFTHIVIKCAWPIVVLIIIVLFHRRGKLDRLLDAAIGFVTRSRYGNGPFEQGEINRNEEDDAESAVEQGDVQVDNAFSGDSTLKFKRNGALKNDAPQNGFKFQSIEFENKVLNRLQLEKKIFINRNVRVYSSNIVFDGAYEKDGKIIAVEVKCRPNRNSLQSYLSRVENFYRALPEKQRENFSLLLCLPQSLPLCVVFHSILS